MSSPLKRLTFGRRPIDDQDRAVMLSRLGIAEEKPRDLFREEPPAPAAEPPAPAPATWQRPANDEHLTPAPTSEPAPPPAPAREEDPFEAIRRQYRNAPATLPRIPAQLQLKPQDKARSRRRQGEMARARMVIWGLAWTAALFVGWALMTGDESSPVVQVFGLLLP